MSSTPTTKPSSDARDDDARNLAACSETFLARHGGPQRLQRDHIHEICSELIRAGVQPTVEAVRQVNGGVGSPNVIHPELKAFYRLRLSVPVTSEAQVPAPTSDPDLPELQELWRDLLRVADKRAHTRLAARETALEDRQAGLAAREEDFLERERLMDERLAGMQAQLQMAEASVGELRGSLAERTRERETLKAEIAQLREQHHAEVGQLRDRLDVAVASSAEARERLAIREGELLAARTEAIAQTRRADEAKTLAEQARAEASSSAERANRLVVERAQLDLDLADTRTRLQHETSRADALAAQQSTLTEELQALRAEHASLQSIAERRGTDLLQLQNALAQARASLTVHEHVEADLRRTREELSKVMRDRDQMLRNPPALLQRLEAIEAMLQKLIPPEAPF